MEPPLKFLVPIKFGQDPLPGGKFDEYWAKFPPCGVYVPDVLLFVAAEPAEPIENEFINDLDISIDDIVTFPAEAVEPL